MEIIGRRKLDKFAQRHSTARSALERWSTLMEEGTFTSFVDLRETFPQADPVPIKTGEKTTLPVFNIGRNVCLIGFVEYEDQIVSIRRVLTHDEYMCDKWKR